MTKHEHQQHVEHEGKDEYYYDDPWPIPESPPPPPSADRYRKVANLRRPSVTFISRLARAQEQLDGDSLLDVGNEFTTFDDEDEYDDNDDLSGTLFDRSSDCFGMSLAMPPSPLTLGASSASELAPSSPSSSTSSSSSKKRFSCDSDYCANYIREDCKNDTDISITIKTSPPVHNVKKQKKPGKQNSASPSPPPTTAAVAATATTEIETTSKDKAVRHNGNDNRKEKKHTSSPPRDQMAQQNNDLQTQKKEDWPSRLRPRKGSNPAPAAAASASAAAPAVGRRRYPVRKTKKNIYLTPPPLSPPSSSSTITVAASGSSSATSKRRGRSV
ncbi:hypothetical protein BDB00DRAFT_846450, partial [Zychaea mexicana]|uniref:uncharacterized protein n=1 Tax=Zychaea mexicana TaxID=64656 RepID=UPI0022FE4B55